VLWRAWERQQPKVIEPRGTISELPIPDRWEQQIGEWRDEINERIREIAASPGRLSRRQPSIAADRLRAVIQTNLRVRYCEAGATEVAGVASRAVRRIHIRVGSSRGSVGDAIALARKARCPERVVLSAETASDKNKLSAKKEFVEILLDGRKDVDMIVADDMTAVMGGGGPGVSSPAIVVEAARPLRGFLHEQLSESAEPSPQGQEAGERILGRLAEIEQALDAAAFGGYAGAVAGERALQLIAAASDELEASLRATEYREARWIEPTELESWLQGEPKGPLRIVARDARSPLLVACRGRGEVTTCVVWARTKPVGAGGTRWVEMDGPCEVLLVGDAVVIGEWTSPDPKGVPSFLAIRDPQLASAIRQATNSAVVL
jgi:hypothetical protein